MQDAPTKLKKLSELMKLTTEGLSRQEFVEAFQKVIDYAKKIKDGNEKEWTLVHAAFSMLESKLRESNTKQIADSHKEHTQKIDMALREQEKGMKFMYDKVGKIIKGKEGEPGKPGKDADHNRIVKDVLAKIPVPKDGYTPKKGVDYWDGKDGKNTPHSSATPHPMKVYDLSSQTNGTLKTFTVPKSVSSIIHMSDFPYVLFEGNGYTFNAQRTQITLTVQNAPTQGSQLGFQYAAMFNTTT